MTDKAASTRDAIAQALVNSFAERFAAAQPLNDAPLREGLERQASDMRLASRRQMARDVLREPDVPAVALPQMLAQPVVDPTILQSLYGTLTGGAR